MRLDKQVAPYESLHVRFEVELPSALGSYRWTGLLYVAMRGHPAAWFRVAITGDLSGPVNRQRASTPFPAEALFQAVRGEAVVLSCEALAESPG